MCFILDGDAELHDLWHHWLHRHNIRVDRCQVQNQHILLSQGVVSL